MEFFITRSANGTISLKNFEDLIRINNPKKVGSEYVRGIFADHWVSEPQFDGASNFVAHHYFDGNNLLRVELIGYYAAGNSYDVTYNYFDYQQGLSPSTVSSTSPSTTSISDVSTLFAPAFCPCDGGSCDISTVLTSDSFPQKMSFAVEVLGVSGVTDVPVVSYNITLHYLNRFAIFGLIMIQVVANYVLSMEVHSKQQSCTF